MFFFPFTKIVPSAFGRKVNEYHQQQKMMQGTTCHHESSSTTGEGIQTNAGDSKPSQSNSQDSQDSHNVRTDKWEETNSITK